MRLFNHSKCQMEEAKKDTCPRCKGHGSVFPEDDNCYLCRGHGELWVSKEGSGWTRSKHAKVDSSRLY